MTNLQQNDSPQGNQEIATQEQEQNNGALISYSGPLPPASEFAKYEQVLPGSADRIIGMAEGQSKHRHFVEKAFVIFGGIQSLAGVIFAAAIALGGMLIGAYLIMNDKPISGFVTMLTPLSIIASAFIYKKVKERDD